MSDTTNDMISLNTVKILNSPTDINSWSVSSQITSVGLDDSVNRGNTLIEFDMKNNWPSFHPIWAAPGELMQYTVWLFLNINNQWYGSGFIQMWKDRFGTGDNPRYYHEDWYYDSHRWAPMTGHQIKVGEIIGFMVTNSDARNNGSAGNKTRSNVVTLQVPPAYVGETHFDSIFNPIPPLPPIPPETDLLQKVTDDVHFIRLTLERYLSK